MTPHARTHRRTDRREGGNSGLDRSPIPILFSQKVPKNDNRNRARDIDSSTQCRDCMLDGALKKEFYFFKIAWFELYLSTLISRIVVQDILIIFHQFSSQDTLIKGRTIINFSHISQHEFH